MEKNLYEKPARYMGAWGYVGWSLLFSIPLVGFILLIVFSFSDNDNLRHFARSYWCWLVLTVAIIGIAILILSLVGENILEMLTREVERLRYYSYY